MTDQKREIKSSNSVLCLIGLILFFVLAQYVGFLLYCPDDKWGDYCFKNDKLLIFGRSLGSIGRRGRPCKHAIL